MGDETCTFYDRNQWRPRQRPWRRSDWNFQLERLLKRSTRPYRTGSNGLLQSSAKGIDQPQRVPVGPWHRIDSLGRSQMTLCAVLDRLKCSTGLHQIIAALCDSDHVHHETWSFCVKVPFAGWRASKIHGTSQSTRGESCPPALTLGD